MERLTESVAPHGPRTPVPCAVVPPHMLERLAAHPDPDIHLPARRSLELDAAHRVRRHTTARTAAPPAAGAAPADTAERTIHDARHSERLPGRKVRSEGGKPVKDAPVNRAYDGLGATFDLYLDVYHRHSVDGAGLPLIGTVHYGEQYDNAFWDGTQMVFGDGDGRVFNDFTVAVDVIGHELTHGVTQYSANLTYHGQSGALNESISDVFGSLVKQHSLGQSADEADWLIGAGLLAPHVNGVALRSMKAPGTAYDDPVLGKDPQPGTMIHYDATTADDGGVHINSGIPNHAFYLVATALGGHAWERAGQIWYDTLTGGQLRPDVDFIGFAAATAATALGRYGDGEEHRAVTAAWAGVGVPTSRSDSTLPRQAAEAARQPERR
ncbi:M4 family metallopeptidase [Streptomyces sp. SL13]|uniref:Neutral metalloproteinase n=1 Tax=Streptantibioticus silvisoli TaxID=2705255 RepID=A0AA90H0T0_9ACTN|nr:M4 family metallopeptidase [Streptantibioticus silvisoli]MDI5961444.1 M4 family metallopeptidase [Streptantibioticus silvisoli]MDI5968027.1 M4 family metallopeptidase [Streptantibioticus silvisoli]